ncbi:MAG: FmdB family zinc ribbon protein [Gammaproteobacteria bacterium]
MPIYEYECQACGHQLEALQKVSDGPLRKCPECGKSRLRKLISAPSFRLKGGGWYETDFKSGNQRNLADKGADGGKDEKPAAKEKEAKPAKEKTETKPTKSADKPAKAGLKPKAKDA